jgi:surface polysaccharide O-acyltransferase-like enzyme
LFPAYVLAVRQPILGMMVLVFLAAKLVLDQWLYGTLAGTAYLEYLVRVAKILTYGGYGIVAASFYGILKRDFDANTGRQIFGVVLLLAASLFMVKLVYAYQIIRTGTWAYNFTPGFWADYLMPPLLFLGIMSLRHNAFPPIFSRLAPFSFGIYLMHPIMMDLVEIMIAPWDLRPWQMVSVKFSLVLASTLLLVMIVSRIPLLSWTIGLARTSRPAPPRPQAPVLVASTGG